MDSIQDSIVAIKEKLPNVTPTPPGLHSQATAHELKARLDWGEPGLTILDVRDRATFQECHIMGAMPLVMESLQQGGKPDLEPTRDIYVYGSTDEETSVAANALRQAGFQNVAELKGGLAVWKTIGGTMEGRATEGQPLKPGAFNVFSRLQEFRDEQAKEKALGGPSKGK